MLNRLNHHWQVANRREFFTRAGSGLAGIALASLLQRDGLTAAPKSVDALAPRNPHHPPKAKSVIWLFMEGGPSHIDLFDPKPKLVELNGQPMPESFGRPITAMGTANNAIMASGSRYATAALTGPPAGLLILAPFWVGFTGDGLTLVLRP